MIDRDSLTLPIFSPKTLTEHMGLSLFPARIAAIALGSVPCRIGPQGVPAGERIVPAFTMPERLVWLQA